MNKRIEKEIVLFWKKGMGCSSLGRLYGIKESEVIDLIKRQGLQRSSAEAIRIKNKCIGNLFQTASKISLEDLRKKFSDELL